MDDDDEDVVDDDKLFNADVAGGKVFAVVVISSVSDLVLVAVAAAFVEVDNDRDIPMSIFLIVCDG